MMPNPSGQLLADGSGTRRCLLNLPAVERVVKAALSRNHDVNRGGIYGGKAASPQHLDKPASHHGGIYGGKAASPQHLDKPVSHRGGIYGGKAASPHHLDKAASQHEEKMSRATSASETLSASLAEVGSRIRPPHGGEQEREVEPEYVIKIGNSMRPGAPDREVYEPMDGATVNSPHDFGVTTPAPVMDWNGMWKSIQHSTSTCLEWNDEEGEDKQKMIGGKASTHAPHNTQHVRYSGKENPTKRADLSGSSPTRRNPSTKWGDNGQENGTMYKNTYYNGWAGGWNGDSTACQGAWNGDSTACQGAWNGDSILGNGASSGRGNSDTWVCKELFKIDEPNKSKGEEQKQEAREQEEEEPEYVIQSTMSSCMRTGEVYEPINGVTVSTPPLTGIDWNRMWNQYSTAPCQGWNGDRILDNGGTSDTTWAGGRWGNDNNNNNNNNAYKQDKNEWDTTGVVVEWDRKASNGSWGKKDEDAHDIEGGWKNEDNYTKHAHAHEPTVEKNIRRPCARIIPHEESQGTVEEKGWNGHAQENTPHNKRWGSEKESGTVTLGVDAEWKEKEGDDEKKEREEKWNNKYGDEKRSYNTNGIYGDGRDKNGWNNTSNWNWNSNWTSSNTNGWNQRSEKDERNRKEEDEKKEDKWNGGDWWKSKRREGLLC